MLENHCFILLLKDVVKTDWGEWRIWETSGMRHLAIPNFSSLIWCQNNGTFKAGGAKAIHCLQVNKYCWILLLVLCLAPPDVPLRSPQGPQGTSLHWEWITGMNCFPWKCYDKSWIAIKDPMNHCETVEEPLDQSFPPGRTHTWHLSPSCLDLVVSSHCA